MGWLLRGKNYVPRGLFAVLTFCLGSFCLGTFSVGSFSIGSASTASPDENYRVAGQDTLEILDTSVVSRTSYNGVDRLIISALPREGRRFAAESHFRVVSEGIARDASAHAELLMNSSNVQHLSAADDPAYLTVLTQPFAVALDSKTLHDLTSLRRPVPFHFMSGMTGGSLHGLLKYRGLAKVDGFETVSITFDAEGALTSGSRGLLPAEPGVAFSGEVSTVGQAFYRSSDALLMKLVTKIVTIGSVGAGQTPLRMRVTYERELSHIPPLPLPAATSSPTPKAIPT
jgi:hypothetical protein